MANSDYYIQDNSDIEDKKIEAAKGLYSAGNYSGALKLYLDMVNTSYSFKLYYEIGRCYYKLNDLGNAEDNFKRSISLEGYKNPSYLYLGNIYFKQQDSFQAIEYWVRAFAYKPNDESVCLNLATSYFSKDMKFQSIFYYLKYLKYSKNKTSSYYLEIKKSIEGFEKIAQEFYQKAQRAALNKDNETAIKALLFAVKNYPIKFDINYLLGRLYQENHDYEQALVYYKQAYSIDNKSLDVLQRLSSVMVELGDFTGAYCCFKRILPLVINNQKEYLNVIKTIKQLEERLGNMNCEGHLNLAKEYYDNNNYHFALFEYENCIIIDNSKADRYVDIIQALKSYINPEERIIKLCFEKGGTFYSNGDFRQSNRYFSKIMTLAGEDSADYKFARSRIVNV